MRPEDTRNPPLEWLVCLLPAGARDCEGGSTQFIEIRTKGADMTISATEPDAPSASRELASRESDGVLVLLHWHPGDGALSAL